MLTTHLITKDMLDKDNAYIGEVDLSDFNGSLELAEGLGWVRFKRRLKVKGYIVARAGTGISAGWGISAAFSIQCKADLRVKLRVFAGLCPWRLPKAEELKIICRRLLSGQVAHGELVQTAAEENADG